MNKTRTNEIYTQLSTVPQCSCKVDVTSPCYFRIFKEVRSLEKQMQELQVDTYEERKKVRSESKVAKATAIQWWLVPKFYGRAKK